MKVLLIKTSSLGDVIHALPAVSEAQKFLPSVSFDWVVEENFAEIPSWHNAVDKVIPIALRRFRHQIWRAIKSGELKNFWQDLRERPYDFIIDAQGLLLKSALVSLAAHGIRCGFDWHSAREPLASLFYQRKFFVSKQHAINRNRLLFAQALGYKSLLDDPDYGLDTKRITSSSAVESKNLIFVHSASRAYKCWPEECWRMLAKKAADLGFTVDLPWGNELEKARALRIASGLTNVKVLAKSNLTELASLFLRAKVIVAGDTGLGHLAAALGRPVVSLYSKTDPSLTGTIGKSQTHILAKTIESESDKMQSTEEVWQAIEKSILPKES